MIFTMLTAPKCWPCRKLHYNVKFVFLLYYFPLILFWVPKVSPPKYRFLAKFSHKSLSNYHRCLT